MLSASIGNRSVQAICHDAGVRLHLLSIFNQAVLQPPTSWHGSLLTLSHAPSQNRPTPPVVPDPPNWPPSHLLQTLYRYAPCPPCFPYSTLQWRPVLWPGAQLLDACAAVQHTIHKTSEWRAPCIIFNADIEKAFDNLKWDALFEVLWDKLSASCPYETLALTSLLLNSRISVPFGPDYQNLPREPTPFQPCHRHHALWSSHFVHTLYTIATMDDLLLLAPDLPTLEVMIQDLFAPAWRPWVSAST